MTGHRRTDPIPALAQLGGAARAHELARRGVRPGVLRALAVHGAVERRAPGLYALPGAPVWAVEAARTGGQLTCALGAEVHGLSVLSRPARPHLRVAGSRSSPVAVLHPRRPDGSSGRCAALVPVLLDCLRCLPAVEAVVVLDSALHQGRVVADDLLRLPGPGAARIRRLVAVADGRAASPLESVCRWHLAQAGLEPQLQVAVPGVGVVDMLLDGWLVLETDGFAFHSGTEDFARDRRRGNALADQGYVLLRFTYRDVVHRPEALVAQVLRVLAGGRRPRPGAPR